MFLNTHFPKAKKYWYQGIFYDWSEGGLHPMVHALVPTYSVETTDWLFATYPARLIRKGSVERS